MGVADRICLYTHPFTARNQASKTLEKVDQVIKQASRDESNNQAFILTIKFLDRRHRWKYRAHSSDYPLRNNTSGSLSLGDAGEGEGEGEHIMANPTPKQHHIHFILT